MTGPSISNTANAIPLAYDKDANNFIAGGSVVPVIKADPTTGGLDAASLTALQKSGVSPVPVAISTLTGGITVGGAYYNDTAVDVTKVLHAGAGFIKILQGQTNAITLTPAAGVSINGLATTSTTVPAILLEEIAPGVYETYAQLALNADGSINANVILRSGTLAALQALSGNNNELAVVTDDRGIAMFNGVAGQAQFVFPDNAGRTLYYAGDANATTGGPTFSTITSDVSVLVMKNTGSAVPGGLGTWGGTFSPSIDSARGNKILKVITDAGFGWGGTGIAASDSILPSGPSITYWQLGTDNFFHCIDAHYSSDATGLAIGANYQQAAVPSTLLGRNAIVSAVNEIAFGQPKYTGQVFGARGIGWMQLFGLTTSTVTTAILNPDGSTSGHGFPFDPIFSAGLYSIKLTVIGKRKGGYTDFCRFVRDAVVQLSTMTSPTLLSPTTPNTPSDMVIGDAAGCAVAVSVDTTNKTFVVTVTGATSTNTYEWYAVAEILKVGRA